MNLTDPQNCPSWEQAEAYVNNPAFPAFRRRMERYFHVSGQWEFSKCSMEYGWNIKWKKSGRSLGTVYLRQGYFTLMVVVGNREKDRAEPLIRHSCPRLKEIYEQTAQANGQRWLMIDLEREDELWEAAFGLLTIRYQTKAG